MPIPPQEAAQKWAQRLGGATQAIQSGVQRVTESPMAKAAAANDIYLARIQESVTSGKRTAALQRSSLEDWRAATLTKGIPRIAAGAQQAIPKMTAFMQAFLPHVESVAARVRQMPKGTVEQGIARVAEQIRGNAAFRRP